MYRAETLIVVTDFETFTSSWDVVCDPILNNGNYILPLGWESELTANGIPYTVEEVQVFEEDEIV